MTVKPIPLTREWYNGPGPYSLQRLVNYFAEPQPGEMDEQFVLRPTPGLQLLYTLDPGPIRAFDGTLPGRYYAVSGNGFYRFRPDTANPGNVLLQYVGAIDGTTNGVFPVATIAGGPVNGCVVSEPNAWAYDHEGGLRQIGGEFPGAASVTYLNGYYIFTSTDDSSSFFISGLLDAESIDPLDFAYADQTPNVIRRAITFNGQLWLIGEAAIEVWYNSGDTDFPFRPVSGGLLTPGTGAPEAVAIADNSVFWMSGDGVVFRSQGYQAKRVSTFAIERELQNYELLNGAGIVSPKMCSFTYEGHIFVALSVMGLNGVPKTFVYDCATQMWGQWSSEATGNGPWRVSYALPSFGLGLMGDGYTGQVWRLSDTVADDAGVTKYREAVLPPLTAHGTRVFMPRLEVEMETGTAAQPGAVQIDWTDDNGATWSTPRAVTTGVKADGLPTRVATTRCGSFRRRSIRVRSTGITTLWGANADVTQGDS